MNKDALNGLLESRRALIDPASVGLERPQRQGRRAPGLSQDQVDQIAGYGNRTYNRLVNGTLGTPSFDLLRAYAKALHLTEQEWFAMCRYARGDDPNTPLYTRSGLEVPGMWKDAIDGSSHMAYITDQAYNLLAHNEAFAGMFPHTDLPTNMMQGMLLSDVFRGTLPDPARGITGRPGILTDWETAWAPYVLPQLRAARAALPGDPTLKRIEQLVIADPRAGALYEKRETAQVHPDGQERPVLHPTLGPCWAQICAAEPLSSPNARVMTVMLYPGATPSQIRRPHLHARAT